MNHPGTRNWSDYAFGLALACILGLAVAHLLGLATPTVDIVLVGGLVIAGTAAWVIQARLVCPHCGAPYGYRFRVVNTHLCPKCRGDMRVE
jgi:hypothetical protein